MVNGKPIAGIVDVGQFLLQGSSGYVESVNFDGTLKIKNGPTIRANDPNGIFGKAYTGRPFMTADDENPSITAFSGFPMCIPRSATDELCPPTNRPNKAQGTLYVLSTLQRKEMDTNKFIVTPSTPSSQLHSFLETTSSTAASGMAMVSLSAMKSWQLMFKFSRLENQHTSVLRTLSLVYSMVHLVNSQIPE